MKYLILLIAITCGTYCNAQKSLMIKLLSNYSGNYNSLSNDKKNVTMRIIEMADSNSLEELNVHDFSKLFPNLSLFKCNIYLTMDHHRNYESCFILFSKSDSTFVVQKPFYWTGPDKNFWEKLQTDISVDTTLRTEQVLKAAIKIVQLMDIEDRNRMNANSAFDSILKFQTFTYLADPPQFNYDNISMFSRIYIRIVVGNLRSKTGYIYTPYFTFNCSKNSKGLHQIYLEEYK